MHAYFMFSKHHVMHHTYYAGQFRLLQSHRECGKTWHVTKPCQIT